MGPRQCFELIDIRAVVDVIIVVDMGRFYAPNNSVRASVTPWEVIKHEVKDYPFLDRHHYQTSDA